MPKVEKGYPIKNKMVNLKVTETERWWWREFARARGLPLSRFIRKSILFYMDHHPEPEEKRA